MQILVFPVQGVPSPPRSLPFRNLCHLQPFQLSLFSISIHCDFLCLLFWVPISWVACMPGINFHSIHYFSFIFCSLFINDNSSSFCLWGLTNINWSTSTLVCSGTVLDVFYIYSKFNPQNNLQRITGAPQYPNVRWSEACMEKQKLPNKKILTNKQHLQNWALLLSVLSITPNILPITLANAVQVQTKTKWNYKPCKRCRTSWSLSKYKRMALMTWNIVDRWVSIKINNWRKDNDSQISTSKKNSLITKNWEALEKIIEVFKTKMTHSMLVL